MTLRLVLLPTLAGAIAWLGAPVCMTAQQLPLSPLRASGQTVTPAFEGWYKNPDGTFSISFGYYNRNTKEIVDIPIGPNNYIEPGNPNQGQPTQFSPSRNWGVFAVKVPANFGDKTKVIWHVNFRGEQYAIPGSLNRAWEIDALQGEAGSGNTPPVLKFDPAGASGAGPGGIYGPPLTAKVGVPMPLTLWATDDGKAFATIAGAGRGNAGVTLTWFVHQGAGEVTFNPVAPRTEAGTGKATTAVTFASPGSYVLRVRANDASGVVAGGHAQCCWSNGFVNVTVTK